MDKRTIVFFVLLMATLGLTDYWFNGQRKEKLLEWTEQQKARKEQLVRTLQSEIATKSLDAEKLPLVELYEDENGNTLFSYGVENNEVVVIQNNSKTPPENLFSRKVGSLEAPVKLSLTANNSGIVLYSAKPDAKIEAFALPDFGHYDLQFVNSTSPLKVTWADYTDGKLTLAVDKINQLRNELEPESTGSNIEFNGILLAKSGESYLPAAIYESADQRATLIGDIRTLSPNVSLKSVTSALKIATNGDPETFYVLENGYQQLVFSNVGGALLEINLPFKSPTDKESPVKEIGYDREMVKDHPYNAYFPAHSYFTPGSNGKDGFVFNQQGHLGGYYPLIRRDLIQLGNRKSVRIPAKFYATNIVSEYPELAETRYQVKYFDKNTIIFEAITGQRKITKTYSIASEDKGAPYCIDLTIDIEGDARGLWLTTGVPEMEWISGGPAPALKVRQTRSGNPEVESLKLPDDASITNSILPDWICNSNGFFGVILDALTPVDLGYRAQYVSGEIVPSRLVEIGQQYEKFVPEKLPGYTMMLPLKAGGGKMVFRIFAGPFSDPILKQVDNTFSDPATGYNPDYIASQSFHGWFSFISEPFTKLLFFLMNMFHTLTGSWALSIVLLTVVLRLMLYPLNTWSARSMFQMQQIAPEVAKIQERNKKDPKKAQVEIMNLYRERGVNPLSGCLPIIIQIPFLMWMYDLLKSTFELRGAEFIPGWIDNLAAPDVLFSWTTPIYFIGNEFHLLPVLLGALMFVQQKYLSPTSGDPNQMTETQRQQRAMGSIMTLAFTFLFYNLPSGLNIYWLSSTLIGMLQQWWTQKQLKSKAVVAGGITPK